MLRAEIRNLEDRDHRYLHQDAVKQAVGKALAPHVTGQTAAEITAGIGRVRWTIWEDTGGELVLRAILLLGACSYKYWGCPANPASTKPADVKTSDAAKMGQAILAGAKQLLDACSADRSTAPAFTARKLYELGVYL